jgi:predicted metal-dependent hydrolase
MEYKIRRSNRKSIGLEITDAGLLVRAPQKASVRDIERVISQHHDWISKKMEQHKKAASAAREKGLLSQDDIRHLAEAARSYIPGRVNHYAQQLGVRPGKITIRNQKTRWGSCSAKGNLNFNCLLMLTHPEIQDYVVVHELCHRLEMNHSPRFWNHVASILPDYRERRAWLKKYGSAIISRMTGR